MLEFLQTAKTATAISGTLVSE